MIEITDAPAKEEIKKVETPSLFISDVLRQLSELESDIWSNINEQDKIKMQNKIIWLKTEFMTIDKENKDIITVNGLKYRRVYE